MQVTKIVQEIGNGGHIYLPKEMIGQKVVITLTTKTIKEIEEQVLGILRPYLKDIEGIYLYGSYARGESTPESDIDILVVTTKKVKLPQRINEYGLVIATEEEIKKTIQNNAVLILPILKEAMPILNQKLIEKYKTSKLTKKNTRWYIETTQSSLSINKTSIDENDDKIIPGIVYSLIMRLRGLYLIEALIHNKKYSNKDIISYIAKKDISLDKAQELYSAYREHRDKKKISDNSLNYEDIARLYDIVYKYFYKVRLLWEKLK